MEKIPYHRPLLTYNNSYMLSNDKKVRELESNIKELYDVEYAIACSSCSQGLLLSIHAFYKIIGYSWILNTPAFTWWSIKSISDILGVKIRYHDINYDTWLMKYPPFNFFSVPNHTFGNITECKGLTIYDGAHALGSKIKDFGYATVFSLAPTKLITSYEGGIIATNNNEMGEYLTLLRTRLSRMPEASADFALKSLKSLDDIKEWKKIVYDHYKKEIPGKFQHFTSGANYNTIGFINENNLKIPEHIEIKRYYDLIGKMPLDSISWKVRNKIICLPSWFGCPYDQITHNILEANNL